VLVGRKGICMFGKFSPDTKKIMKCLSLYATVTPDVLRLMDAYQMFVGRRFGGVL
jgi:hypothetical protein